MSALQSGSLAKLQDLLPNQIGSNRRWPTALVEDLIMLAARAAAERIGFMHREQEIDLTDGTSEYTLDSEFISVVRVDYASSAPDGGSGLSTYDDYLEATTFSKFDEYRRSWRSDTGVRPEWYTLLSTPGTPAASIFIYPPIATVGGQRIRVKGLGIPAVGTTVHEDIQDRFIVPYVMSMLYATEDEDMAAQYMGEVESAVPSLRGRYASEYSGEYHTNSEEVEWWL